VIPSVLIPSLSSFFCLFSFFCLCILDVVITGYGEDDVMNGYGELEPIRYWIARNSWGQGWGEHGFIRIKRGPGGKHIPGVCGIARSPSVALGGTLRQDRYKPLLDANFRSANMDPTKVHLSDYMEPYGHDSASIDHPFCDSISSDGSILSNGCLWIAK
jgi:hypothetical protein